MATETTAEPSARDDDVLARVRSALGEPRLARNLRGQVKAALGCLPIGLQGELACTFVEHALERLIGDRPPEYREAFAVALRAVRDALAGTGEPEAVHRRYVEAIAFSTVEEKRSDGTASISTGPEGNLLRLVGEGCEQIRRQAAGLVPNRRSGPSAAEIVDVVGHRIARFTGGDEWDAEDVEQRKNARRRGREASDAETRWQLAALLEVLQQHETV